MNDLQLYGWNERLFQQKQESKYKEFAHGRVVVTHKTCCEVVAEDGFYVCELSGNVLNNRDSSEYPCTGDWIIFKFINMDKGLILDMLPRQKTLYRLRTGTVAEKQTIASYVDKALIVHSLDCNFNIRRIERFMLQVVAESIQPILILTKADLEFDKERIELELRHISHKVPVIYTSITLPESIKSLRKLMHPGETVVFIGPSGVGKSTLINMLYGRQIVQTGEISDSTGKGRHTSTRREMVLLPDSGVLIDTPGIKLFGVTDADAANLTEVFSLSEYEGRCQFRDCRHINEKGCAIIEAVNNGEIEQSVYNSYLKLRREAWHYTASTHEKRKQERMFSKMVKKSKKRF